MSGLEQEWVIFLSLFLFFVSSTVVEAIWLNRKGRASFGKSLGFSVLTNFIGYSIGFFVFFVIIGVFMGMAWGGSIKNVPEYALSVSVSFAVLFVPVSLTVCKRMFLSVLKK